MKKLQLERSNQSFLMYYFFGVTIEHWLAVGNKRITSVSQLVSLSGPGTNFVYIVILSTPALHTALNLDKKGVRCLAALTLP